MIFAGPGAGATADPAELMRFVETTRIPVFTEDSARALIPDDHPYSMGFGYLPLNKAAQRIGEADAVLLLGRRLDYMVGFGGTPPFAAGVRQIVVDPAAAEIGRARSVEVGILGDVGQILTQLADAAENTAVERIAVGKFIACNACCSPGRVGGTGERQRPHASHVREPDTSRFCG